MATAGTPSSTELLDDPDNAWWDDVNTRPVEKRDDILLAAMTDARKELTSLMSRDTHGWQWGQLHQVTLESQTLGHSGIGPVEPLFNRGDWPVGGGPGGGRRDGFDDTRGYRVTTGPTMRMLVDLGRPGQLAVDQPERHLRPRLPPELRRPGPAVGGEPALRFVAGRSVVEGLTEHRLNLVPTG